jgi:myosin-5
MKASMLRISGRSSGQPQSNHWQKIIENLNVLLKVLQDNHVCLSLFDSFLYVIRFSWMCVQLSFCLPSGTPCLGSENFHPDILIH